MVQAITSGDVELAYNEFQLVKDGDITRAIRPELHIEVEGGRMFHRNGIKFPGNRRLRYLVAELDGVRLYVDAAAGGIIMTKRDLYP